LLHTKVIVGLSAFNFVLLILVLKLFLSDYSLERVVEIFSEFHERVNKAAIVFAVVRAFEHSLLEEELRTGKSLVTRSHSVPRLTLFIQEVIPDLISTRLEKSFNFIRSPTLINISIILLHFSSELHVLLEVKVMSHSYNVLLIL
jgi:hypothetical protein